MERLYEATIRPVIAEQTVNENSVLSNKLFISTHITHTFHFNTDSLHLARAHCLLKASVIRGDTDSRCTS